MASPEIKICSSDKQIADELCTVIGKSAKEAIDSAGCFRVGVSGGSLVDFLRICLPNVQTEWDKWRIFFCDERVVPFEDAASTYGLYTRALIGTVPVEEEQIIAIEPLKPLKEVAEDYVKKLKLHFPRDELPRFDLLLLGMGPDGHTCSLFPGHKALQVTSEWVTEVDDSPKPPPNRITLTLPVVNNAQRCVFVTTGASKAEPVKRILEGKEANPLPAGLVRPTNGQLIWILDEDAASLLTK